MGRKEKPVAEGREGLGLARNHAGLVFADLEDRSGFLVVVPDHVFRNVDEVELPLRGSDRLERTRRDHLVEAGWREQHQSANIGTAVDQRLNVGPRAKGAVAFELLRQTPAVEQHAVMHAPLVLGKKAGDDVLADEVVRVLDRIIKRDEHVSRYAHDADDPVVLNLLQRLLVKRRETVGGGPFNDRTGPEHGVLPLVRALRHKADVVIEAGRLNGDRPQPGMVVLGARLKHRESVIGARSLGRDHDVDLDLLARFRGGCGQSKAGERDGRQPYTGNSRFMCKHFRSSL